MNRSILSMVGRLYSSPGFYLLIISIFVVSCKSGPFNVFKPASPHELYERTLVSSGLSKTAMGKSWIDLADKVLESPVSVAIPYLEKGYFPAEKIRAAAFSFKMERGQKLNVRISRKPLEGFTLYTDVWERDETGSLTILGSADTLGTSFQSDVNTTATYVLRLQPELLSGGEYTLEITAGPSLDYPLKSYQNNQIRSFWGDGRDAGSRKHEGVDIFSPFRTPVLAVAAGTARVNENRLGGKVVWLRAEGKDYSLYYAHLDEQVVADGQFVQIGDTIGLMGNTGNAKTTPPHLHFGIYTRGGAVDPLPFINPRVKETPAITSDISSLNDTMRTSSAGSLSGSIAGSPVSLKGGTIVNVIAASANTYRVQLPDGTEGFMAASKLSGTSRSLRRVKLNASQLELFDKPDTSAAVKATLQKEGSVNVLGAFGDYDLVSTGEEKGWIKR